jgi:hypothetical protein
MTKVIGFVLVLVLTSSFAWSQGIDSASCRQFGNEFNAAMQKLGPFPSDSNELPRFEKKGNKWVLDPTSLPKEQIPSMRTAISWVTRLKLQHRDFAACVFSILDEDAMEWWTYINSHYTGSTELPSPNFYKATYLTVNLRPFGAIRPFINGEGYSSSYDLLIGRTINRRDPWRDRNLRLNIGAKYLHQYEHDELLGLASVDWKLKDVQIAGLFNIGLIKLQFQGYVNADIVGLEAGLGFESYGFGLQIISLGYQEYYETSGLYFQSGVSITPFELAKFFKTNRL